MVPVGHAAGRCRLLNPSDAPVSHVSSAIAGLLRRKEHLHEPDPTVKSNYCPSLFASTGSIGAVDLGASHKLSSEVSKCQSCSAKFQNGSKRMSSESHATYFFVLVITNHQTLVSRQAFAAAGLQIAIDAE